MTKISIGADHRGFATKQDIIKHLAQYSWNDVGTFSADRTDYPLYAKKVCLDILDGHSNSGVLLCATGIGMSMAANRFRGIYAALCWNSEIARLAREDDGANVLILPSDYVSTQEAFRIIEAWLGATPKDGVYKNRLQMIDSYK